LDLEDIKAAHIVYSDRVYSFRRLIEIDKLLDSAPTEELVKETAELGIRNRLCFEELQTLNSKGKLLYKHPFITSNKEHDRLVKLLTTSPDKFLEEFKNVSNNISRYQSYLKREGASQKEKDNWNKQVVKHTATLELMKSINESWIRKSLYTT